MWTFLMAGGFGAIGAAMAVGTGAALLRYHRTGEWPGRQPGTEVSTARVVGLYLRVTVGLIVAGYAIVSLADANLLY